MRNRHASLSSVNVVLKPKCSHSTCNSYNQGTSFRKVAASKCRFGFPFILFSVIQLSRDTNAFLRRNLRKSQAHININDSVNMNNHFKVTQGPPRRMLSDGEIDFDKSSSAHEDARAFNMIISAAVDLSDASVHNDILHGMSYFRWYSVLWILNHTMSPHISHFIHYIDSSSQF
jgi:hypothetical protein